MSRQTEGTVLLCDKPAGITSHDMVVRLRRERGCKAGHAGTLDPFATGLLLVLLDGATRLQRYLTALPKTYLATARLGWRSSTGDPDGDLEETGRRPASLALPMGTVRQRVPMTSAVKVEGERLYRKAHPARRSRPRARRRRLSGGVARTGRGQCPYEIECSSGTYVRTLLETLGDAYCAELRRTTIGPFSVEDAGAELSVGQVGGADSRGCRGGPLMAPILVTSLPDAKPRPRDVAIGTFDGEPSRPPGCDQGL